MIKFTANAKSERTLIGIGLSRENCRRLLAGEPIAFSGAEIGLPDKDFVIIGGETEMAIRSDLHRVITPETRIVKK